MSVEGKGNRTMASKYVKKKRWKEQVNENDTKGLGWKEFAAAPKPSSTVYITASKASVRQALVSNSLLVLPNQSVPGKHW